MKSCALAFFHPSSFSPHPSIKRRMTTTDQQQIAKQQWAKPELTVLVRRNPEEAVLTGCKTATTGSEVNAIADNCSDTALPCAACEGTIGS